MHHGLMSGGPSKHLVLVTYWPSAGHCWHSIAQYTDLDKDMKVGWHPVRYDLVVQHFDL